MQVLIVEPGQEPRIANIAGTLKSMQETVGGYIQTVFPWREDRVVLVCDEEGLLKDAAYNRTVAPGMHIFGTFFLCGYDDEDLTELTEKLAEKYRRILATQGE